jgi:hypothetical protein
VLCISLMLQISLVWNVIAGVHLGGYKLAIGDHRFVSQKQFCGRL